jgi:hypothetical protein
VLDGDGSSASRSGCFIPKNLGSVFDAKCCFALKCPVYQKLDNLIKQSQTTRNGIKNTNTPSRLINLTNTTFTKEYNHILTLGPNYALTKDPEVYINELVIDTENAIRKLDSKIQNTFRYMASTNIKQILTANTHHTLHKRYQYNLNNIKSILRKNNLTIAKADKNKAIVIINKDVLEQRQ